MFQRIVRERQIFRTSIEGLSQQKGGKEYPDTGDMSPVGYSHVEDSFFSFRVNSL